MGVKKTPSKKTAFREFVAAIASVPKSETDKIESKRVKRTKSKRKTTK